MESRIRIESVHPPTHYTLAQVERATRIARVLGCDRLVLCERPEG